MSNDSSNIFFINLKKNVGKKSVINHIASKLHATIFNGIDKSIYDKNIMITQNRHLSTRAAKESKLSLLSHFIDTCPHNYLVLFEDDVVIHRNFFDLFNKTIEFANSHTFKLIYLGVSCKVKLQNSTDTFHIHNLPTENFRYSGAYGVVIHRSIIPQIILKSNDPFLFNRPFDIYSLGSIQLSHPHDCFITVPQLVIPYVSISDIRAPRNQYDFWSICDIDPAFYLINSPIPLFVRCFDDKQKIINFVVMLSSFIPYIEPIFVSKSNIVQDIFGNIFKTILTDNFSVVDNIQKNNKYAITDIYVNWTCDIDNIFEISSSVKYIASGCPLCNNSIVNNIELVNGIEIYCDNDNLDIIDNKKLYSTYSCDKNSHIYTCELSK